MQLENTKPGLKESIKDFSDNLVLSGIPEAEIYAAMMAFTAVKLIGKKGKLATSMIFIEFGARLIKGPPNIE